MSFIEFPDDSEDPDHRPAERAAVASRSTWVSVGVNLVLTVTQVVVGVLAKSQGLVADGIDSLSVEAGHDIAVDARHRVIQRHRVLNVMTHVDPWRRPDLNHPPVGLAANA